MTLAVYFSEDIGNVLAGLLVVAVQTHAGGNDAHLQGVVTFARGLALSFGVSWSDVVGSVRGELGSGCAGLLDA